LNYGKDYKYAHDYANNFVEQQYLPDDIKNERIWKAQDSPAEKTLSERMRALWKGKKG